MKRKGVSLIEMTITIALVAIIGSLMSMFIMKGLDIWVFYRDLNTAQTKARMSMDRITSAIRFGCRNGAHTIEDNQFTFIVPEMRNGNKNVIGFIVERGVLYYLDMFAYLYEDYEDIYKEENNIEIAGETFLKFKLANVSNLGFSYYRVSSTDIDKVSPGDTGTFNVSDPPERLIKVVLETSEGGQSFALGTVVRMRNRLPMPGDPVSGAPYLPGYKILK